MQTIWKATYNCLRRKYVRKCEVQYVCMYIYIYIYSGIYNCMRTHIYIHVHTCKHTHGSFGQEKIEREVRIYDSGKRSLGLSVHFVTTCKKPGYAFIQVKAASDSALGNQTSKHCMHPACDVLASDYSRKERRC